MRIAYLTTYDSSDPHAWSGSGYSIPEALIRRGADVVRIGPLNPWSETVARIIKLLYLRVFREKKFQKERMLFLAKAYSREAQRKLAGLRGGCDLILSAGCHPISFLRSRIPIVLWTDATFRQMIDFYPEYTDLADMNLRDGDAIEASAFRRSSILFFTSDWARQSAVRDYSVAPSKAVFLPFGSNLNSCIPLDKIQAAIAQKSLETIRLVFISVDWHRKGGNAALDIASEISRKFPVELHVIGDYRPNRKERFVTHHGFLKRNSIEGLRKIEEILMHAHFLILPTKADCVPVVLAEANSFGLPCITSDVGGIRSAITHGENGWLFTPGEDPALVAETVLAATPDRDSYRRIAQRSFEISRHKLNWDVSAERLLEMVMALR